MNTRLPGPSSVSAAALTTLVALGALALAIPNPPSATPNEPSHVNHLTILASSKGVPVLLVGAPAWLLERLARSR